ncbi:MAG: hypothetical protein ACJZZG_04035 [Cytophagales bacterium]
MFGWYVFASWWVSRGNNKTNGSIRRKRTCLAFICDFNRVEFYNDSNEPIDIGGMYFTRVDVEFITKKKFKIDIKEK